MSSKPVSNSAFITTGAVPQVGSAAAGGWVGAMVGATVAGAVVAGAVVGAWVAVGGTGVAAAPQAASNMETTASKLATEENTIFLLISHSPFDCTSRICHRGQGLGF